MGRPHVCGAVRVVELDDHRNEHQGAQVNNLVVPAPPDGAAEGAPGVRSAPK